MSAALAWLGTGLWWLSAATGWAALAFMTIVGAADVLGTALFSKPLQGTFEMSAQALAAVIFLGVLHTQINQSHIVVDIFIERLTAWPARLSKAVALSATALALGLIAVQTWPQFTASYAISEQASGALNFPIWPIKGLVSIGALSAMAVAAVQAVIAWIRLFGSSPETGEPT
ncbi:TRAP transporter small permease subunit [Pararhodobacter oceanensis]|uniref:TRAP transporter small permease subunit n=1 Tax=Pararhodobacter oceanensis TaxID=2172121 RepID=UPI003A8E00B5